MKKFIFLFVVALAAVTGAKADDYTISGEGSAVKGGVGMIAINLENDADVRAVEFTLNLPSTLTVSVNGTKNTSRTNAFKVTYDDDTNIVTITTQDEVAIAAGSGAIAYIQVDATNVATTDDLEVSITGCVISFSGTSELELTDESFNVIIVDSYVLNETSTILPPTTTNNVNVTVNRTLKANAWNTLCLPFATDASNIIGAIEAAGGDGTTASLCYLSGCTTNTQDNSITVSFTSYNSGPLNANYPVIVKPSKDIDQLTFNGVKIEPNEANAKEEIKTTGPGASTAALFIGTLKAGTVPADNLFLSNNKFYYSDGSNTILGFRGYFWLKDFSSGSSSTDGSRLMLNVDGEPTAIYDINSETGAFTIEDGRIYDLNGVELSSPTKKGIYIQNGKKIVVK